MTDPSEADATLSPGSVREAGQAPPTDRYASALWIR